MAPTVEIKEGDVCLDDLRRMLRELGSSIDEDEDRRFILKVHPRATLFVERVADADVVVPDGIGRDRRAVEYYRKETREQLLRDKVIAFFGVFSDSGLLPTHLLVAADEDQQERRNVDDDGQEVEDGRANVVSELRQWAMYMRDEYDDDFVAARDAPSVQAFRAFAGRLTSLDRMKELRHPDDLLILFDNIPSLRELTVCTLRDMSSNLKPLRMFTTRLDVLRVDDFLMGIKTWLGRFLCPVLYTSSGA